MKNFFIACKKRPLILWISFFIWLAVCSLFSFIIIRDLKNPAGLLFYLFVIPPICHLVMFVKPLLLIEAAQILTAYAIPINIFLDALVEEIPSAWLTASSIICIVISLGLLVLELTVFKNKIISKESKKQYK